MGEGIDTSKGQDDLIINRNCGYCNETIPSINFKEFMVHVDVCEVMRCDDYYDFYGDASWS